MYIMCMWLTDMYNANIYFGCICSLNKQTQMPMPFVLARMWPTSAILEMIHTHRRIKLYNRKIM